MTRRAVPLRAAEARVRPLRANEPEWLGFARHEVRAALLGAVLLGVAYAATATTVGGGFGMFGLGALMGLLFGLRVGDQYVDAGRIFRWAIVFSAVVIALVDVGFVIRWVF